MHFVSASNSDSLNKIKSFAAYNYDFVYIYMLIISHDLILGNFGPLWRKWNKSNPKKTNVGPVLTPCFICIWVGITWLFIRLNGLFFLLTRLRCSEQGSRVNWLYLQVSETLIQFLVPIPFILFLLTQYTQATIRQVRTNTQAKALRKSLFLAKLKHQRWKEIGRKKWDSKKFKRAIH